MDQPCAACALTLALFPEGPDPDELESTPATGRSPVAQAPFAPADMSFDASNLPSRLGPFLVQREIAVGGMGAVYESVDTRANRTVALKLLRCLLLVNETDKARFRIEAEAAARLDHPNIVPVYEVGELQRQPYFTMKLMEGGSLAERLRDGHPAVREAVRLVSKISGAVQHAHQRGVLHRDIKPGNVLFDATGEPYLADFGLAKLVNVDTSLTLTSEHLGTPHYMSPEQAAGNSREIGTASDVWALGVLLYQLVARRLPFPGEGRAEIYRRIAEEEPIPPSRALAEVVGEPPTSGARTRSDGRRPSSKAGTGAERRGDSGRAGLLSSSQDGVTTSALKDFDTLCLRCLEKDPAARIPDAGWLANELERWLRGEPIESRPITSFERGARWMRRNPGLTVLGAALGLALFAGTLVSTVLWRRAEAAHAGALSNAARANANALVARHAEDRAADQAYFATLTQAAGARREGDLGHARRLLSGLEPARRGFEWRLLDWLCRGDDLERAAVPGGEPRTLAWDSTRRRVAILSEDRALRWFDPSSGRFDAGPSLPDAWGSYGEFTLDRGFHGLEIAPGGRHLLCGDGDVFMVAETDTGRLRFTSPGRRMGGVWLDENRCLYAGNVVWGAARGDETGLFDLAADQRRPLTGRVFGPLALSADRTRLAWVRSTPRGDIAEIHSVADVLRAGGQAEPLRRVALEIGSPGVMAFSADGRQLGIASGNRVGTLDVVSVFDLEEVDADGVARRLDRLDLADRASAIAFVPREPALAFGADAIPLRLIRPTAREARSATYDDDSYPGLGQIIGTNGPLSAPASFLTRSAENGRLRFLMGHEAPVLDLRVLPESGRLATVSRDGTLRQWPMTSTAPRSRLGGVWSWNQWDHPAMSVDGRFIAYLAETNQTWVWDRFADRRSAYPVSHHPLAVLRDGRVVTRHSDTGEIVVWAAPTSGATNGVEPAPRELWRLPGIPSHPGFGPVIRGALSRDERWVVGLIPGKLLAVDLVERRTAGTRDQRMLYGANEVNCMDLSPDGSIIAATGLVGRRVRLYRTSAIRGGFETLSGAGSYEDYDTAVAFHPDGRRIYVGNEDGFVRVFDVATRSELVAERWRAHSVAVIGLAVSTDGRLIATSGDRSVRFWDAIPGEGGERRDRLRLPLAESRHWMRFAAGDRVFVHVGAGHPLEVWEAPP